jgi:hypothetical protein
MIDVASNSSKLENGTIFLDFLMPLSGCVGFEHFLGAFLVGAVVLASALELVLCLL